MAKSREIKGRMKAVSNIQRITRTMQMIATARFQSALRRATSSKPYSAKISELVGELSAAGGSLDHPLLRAPDPVAGRELLLVITSNRGLCGAYNSNVLREASRFYRQKQADGVELDLEVAGKKGVGYFRFAHIDVSTVHDQFGDKPAYAEVEQLAQHYMDAFDQGQYDAIHIASMSFQSTSRQRPEIFKLLPLDRLQDAEASGPAQGAAQGPVEADAQSESKPASGGEAIYDFSPDPAELLAQLLPASVKIALFQRFNEAIVSEQVARMVAMKSATDAAGKMGKNLTRQYNRARQTAITTELTEIIGGTAALE